MATPDPDAGTVVTFKNVPVFNDGKSTAEGRPIYDDQVICEVKFAANKQTVGAYPAHEVCGWTEDPSGMRVPQTYAMKFNEQYLAFMNGDGQAQDGTPLEAATFISASKRLELKALNIYTLEALASLDGQPLKRLGMGGRTLQAEAAAFLEKAPGVATEQLVGVVADQDRRIAELEAQLAAAKPSPLDHDKNGKKGGAAPAVETKPNDTKGEKSAFEDFEDDDIKNWLKEAAPDMAVDGRWSRETLLAKADEVNKALATKNKGV